MTAKPKAKPKAKAHGTKVAVKRTSAPSPDMRARNPTPLHEIIGNRIRVVRIAKGMSQQALSDKLGLSFQQVQKYEKGTNRLDAARLIQIAEVLEVDVMDIYGDLTKRRMREGPSDHERYIATSECQRLLDAMLAIENGPIRWRIVHLAEAIARNPEEVTADVDD